MLQQTTVAAVVPYYRRFVARFPDLHRLAAADEEAVLGLWSGLGYYRRARNLQRACREIAGSRQGRFPETAAELARLPGIGPYTAGAVASIAFGQPAPVLDGNVLRVLSRLAGSRGRDAASRRLLLQAAGALVAGPRPGDLNQALMELGATICTPRAPGCSGCPLRRSCAAHASGAAESFPEPPPRAAAVTRQGLVLMVRSGAGVYLVRRPATGVLAGLWELPGIPGDAAAVVTPHLAAALATAEARLGRRLRAGGHLADIRHTVLNRRIHLGVHAAHFLHADVAPPPRADVRLLAAGAPPPPLTAATRKALAAAGPALRRGRGAQAGTRMRHIIADGGADNARDRHGQERHGSGERGPRADPGDLGGSRAQAGGRQGRRGAAGRA
jgi:A/G-specific adenine glycosylase